MSGGTDGFLYICYAIFNRNDGERKVNVNWNDNRWNRNYRFAGSRNSLLSPQSVCGVFFLNLSQPTSQYLANLI